MPPRRRSAPNRLNSPVNGENRATKGDVEPVSAQKSVEDSQPPLKRRRNDSTDESPTNDQNSSSEIPKTVSDAFTLAYSRLDRKYEPQNIVVSRKGEMDQLLSTWTNWKSGDPPIFISGQPGTGKTMCIRRLCTRVDVPIVWVNGMKLSKEKDGVNKLLSRYLTPDSNDISLLCVIDEADRLIDEEPEAALKLFAAGNIAVIAIANSPLIDHSCLPENTRRLIFKPYGWSQILEILHERVGSIVHPVLGNKIFEKAAIEMCARDISRNRSGDVRKALDVCREAVAMVMRVQEDTQDVNAVTVRHVTACLNVDASRRAAILQMTTLQKVLVKAVCSVEKSPVSELELFRAYSRVCKQYGLPQQPKNDARYALGLIDGTILKEVTVGKKRNTITCYELGLPKKGMEAVLDSDITWKTLGFDK